MNRLTAAKTIGVVVLALTPVTAPSPSSAHNARSLGWVGMGRGDWVLNYDFHEQVENGKNFSKKADWGVSLLFYNNAEVDKVKEIGDELYDRFGANKHGVVEDKPLQKNGTGGARWDADAGIKDTRCPRGDQRAIHFRIYAPSTSMHAERDNDRMYNTTFGYYVIATTHVDHNECWRGAWFDGAERAEDHVSAFYRRKGYAVYEDWAYFYNYEPHRVEGDHTWDSNGYITAINITNVK